MKVFDYIERPVTLITPDIVKLLTSIHEHRGKLDLFFTTSSSALVSLTEVAKIQSTGSSNRIEGIQTTDKRLEELVRNKSQPRNRSEQEIAGYRDVLATIHESYEYIYPSLNIVLQLHKQLFSFNQSSSGGRYKNVDNYITETEAVGNVKTRFKPVPAYLTSDAMERLCAAFNEAGQKKLFDDLLLIPMFVLDFLCIHPFNDGNGRLSRLLSLLLLFRAGYTVGKFISLEKLIENSKDTYYEVLQQSSLGWQDNDNNYLPFIRYYLGILQKAYNSFQERIAYISPQRLSKPERIKATIDRTLGKITKKEIMETCPDISRVTVERALTALVKDGYIIKVGSGRATSYKKAEKNS